MSGSFNPPVMSGSITAANASYVLAIANLYPQGVQLQGFGEGQAFETEDQEIAETRLGVDGGFTGGYVPVYFDEKLTFLANSASCQIFDVWYETQKATASIYYATATIYLPAMGRKLTRTQGILMRYSPISALHKVAEDRSFTIRWGQTSGAVL